MASFHDRAGLSESAPFTSSTDAKSMTLEQLRVFVEVAERLHVTRAAAALNMTQPAASAVIRALETRLGTVLFNRVGRRFELTEAGTVLLPEAKVVLAKVAGAEQALTELDGLLRGRLRLWASQTIAGYWLPPFLYRFHVAHPGVILELDIGNTLQVSRAVLEGAADLGFVEGDVDEPLLVKIPVAVDQLVLVVAKSHELASLTSLECIERDHLRGTPWVLREKGSGTRQVFEDDLRRRGVDPAEFDVVMELPSNEAVRSVVEAGAGATVISRLVVADKLAAGTLVELPLHCEDRPYTVLRHGDRHRGRAESALLEMMRPSRRSAGCGAVLNQISYQTHKIYQFYKIEAGPPYLATVSQAAKQGAGSHTGRGHRRPSTGRTFRKLLSPTSPASGRIEGALCPPWADPRCEFSDNSPRAKVGQRPGHEIIATVLI